MDCKLLRYEENGCRTRKAKSHGREPLTPSRLPLIGAAAPADTYNSVPKNNRQSNTAQTMTLAATKTHRVAISFSFAISFSL